MTVQTPVNREGNNFVSSTIPFHGDSKTYTRTTTRNTDENDRFTVSRLPHTINISLYRSARTVCAHGFAPEHD